MDPFALIGNLAGRVKGSIGDTLAQFVPQSTYNYNYAKPAGAPDLVGQVQAGASRQAVRGFEGAAPIEAEQLQALLSQNRGADTPILSDLDLLIAAGNQLPENLDPLLPLILAIRETQGGRYNKGQNNPYNIRGQNLAGGTEFINYPDLQTATLGGQNPLYGGIESQGLLGLLGQNDIYSEFRQTGNLEDLFAHYSPPADNNGDLEEQAQNYRWIRNQILGIPQ